MKKLKEILVRIADNHMGLSILKSYYAVFTTRNDTRLRQFHNSHKGETCYVVGLGPSLNMDDINLLYKNNAFCFSVNSVYRMFANIKWRPNIYCITDRSGINEEFVKYSKEMVKEGIQIIYSNSCPKDSMPSEAVSFKEHNCKWTCTNSKNLKLKSKAKKYRQFSTNAYFCIYGGMSCIISIIQLAYYMGFKNVVLLGVDCGAAKGEEYSQLIDKHNTNTYKEDAFDLLIEDFENLNKKIKKMKLNFNIYNATRGGNLEAFPRVELEKIINDSNK